MFSNSKLQSTVVSLIALACAGAASADEVVQEKEQVITIESPKPAAPAPEKPAAAMPVPRAAPAAAPAMAALMAGNWFLGAGIGRTTLNDYKCTGCPAITNNDDNDTGFNVFGGYRFNDYFALQAEYVDLGDRDYTGPAPVSDKHDVSGFGLVGVGIWPVNSRLDVFAKAGVFRWDQDISYSNLGITTKDSFSGTDLSYGLGATYFMDEGRNLGLQGEWRRFKDVGTNDPVLGHQNDYDMLSVNLIYYFR